MFLVDDIVSVEPIAVNRLDSLAALDGADIFVVTRLNGNYVEFKSICDHNDSKTFSAPAYYLKFATPVQIANHKLKVKDVPSR